MPRYAWFALLVFGLACGVPPAPANGPKTAREKQLMEAKAEEPPPKPPAGKKWRGWRYQGDRSECFFTFESHCYKTREAACKAAKCAAPKKCDVEDGGPSIVSCK
ncbi:MAG: hypothetical protein R3B48_13620 [Kofleriaceae bacterium]